MMWTDYQCGSVICSHIISVIIALCFNTSLLDEGRRLNEKFNFQLLKKFRMLQLQAWKIGWWVKKPSRRPKNQLSGKYLRWGSLGMWFEKDNDGSLKKCENHWARYRTAEAFTKNNLCSWIPWSSLRHMMMMASMQVCACLGQWTLWYSSEDRQTWMRIKWSLHDQHKIFTMWTRAHNSQTEWPQTTTTDEKKLCNTFYWAPPRWKTHKNISYRQNPSITTQIFGTQIPNKFFFLKKFLYLAQEWK